MAHGLDERDGKERDPVRRPTWVGYVFLFIATVLAAWTVWVTHNLPRRQLAAHWNVAWAGFDVMLTIALALTGIAAIRRSPWLLGAAACASTLLVVDAWFDILTANGHHQVMVAVAAAVFLELPLAAGCLYIAMREKRVLAPRR